MKIMFCIKSMNNTGGGAERVLASIANALANKEYDIYILSFDSNLSESFYDLSENITRINLSIGSTTTKATCIETITRIKAIRKVIRELSPDVAIGFMHSAFIPLSIACIGLSTPTIASEHTVYTHYRAHLLQKFLNIFSSYLHQKIICVSDESRLSFPKFLRKKMEVIYNPITIDTHKKANVIGKNDCRKIMLTVGRLDHFKNHDTLIRAFKQISDQIPDWDLKIVGAGELEQKLRQTIHDLELSDRVLLVGAKKDIIKEYLSALFFILPSVYESFALVLHEAYLCGLPSIGFSQCPNVGTSIKHDYNGLIVDGSMTDIKNLSAAIEQMTQKEIRLRLAKNLTNNHSKYELNNVVSQWEKVISNIHTN